MRHMRQDTALLVSLSSSCRGTYNSPWRARNLGRRDHTGEGAVPLASGLPQPETVSSQVNIPFA